MTARSLTSRQLHAHLRPISTGHRCRCRKMDLIIGNRAICARTGSVKPRTRRRKPSVIRWCAAMAGWLSSCTESAYSIDTPQPNASTHTTGERTSWLYTTCSYTLFSWASAHRGKWGQLTPWKMDEKIKKRKRAKRSSFLCLCYILRAIRAGRCRERRYADHIFIQIYFRMQHFVVKFSKFSSPQAARGN